jgi:hypothetical protein
MDAQLATAEPALNRFTWPEDRVRANTDPQINRRIDEDTEFRIRLYANQDPALISRRIAELEQEWDIERVLEANASTLGLAGLFLGATVNRLWFFFPAVIGGFLLWHALQGWCPPVPILRRRGIRTRQEIERERYALKVLRGDFAPLGNGEHQDVNRVIETVMR